ncbi:MAG TPA: fructose bisphosphate aldolase [Streptosporangiaceae bacterium]|nr:fructose bisphosphate aldolase [Streptosporangiaceae bacterium]
MNQDQLRKMRSGAGFIAALDQSGGSTPGALAAYGIDASQYSGDAQMLGRMHEMRTRIMTSPSFGGDRILAAILFENTMDRQVEGRATTDYLWSVRQVVPFLKIDKGLAAEAAGVQLMKPIPGLSELLDRGAASGVLGTKMRSVIKLADPDGIAAIVGQQFEIGAQVLSSGLIPILEPEISISSPQKAAAEKLLRAAIEAHLAGLGPGRQVMLKLTLPEEDGFYGPLAAHPAVLRVVALSGGYSRAEACRRLARNHGIIASFSRALTEGLQVSQSDAEFNAQLDRAIAEIYAASVT